VYANDAKIAALGLKVKRGCAYHGVSLNVDGDLQPFAGINPCGYQGLRVTSLAALGVAVTGGEVSTRLAAQLRARFDGLAMEQNAPSDVWPNGNGRRDAQPALRDDLPPGAAKSGA
jgi:lipoate-protein ligase B